MNTPIIDKHVRGLHADDLEVHFSLAGNTVMGSYTDYLPLDNAIRAKSKFFPAGRVIKGSKTDIARLAEYVWIFGNCIQTPAAWDKAVELAGCEKGKTI